MTFVRTDKVKVDEAEDEVWRKGRSSVCRQSSYINRLLSSREPLAVPHILAVELECAIHPESAIEHESTIVCNLLLGSYGEPLSRIRLCSQTVQPECNIALE